MERTIERTDVGYRLLPNLRWGAIIAGVLCALAIEVTLGLFGVAIGFAARPAANTGAVGTLATVWGICVPLVACFFGGWLAVRLARTLSWFGALMHGLLVWCIGLIAGALFVSASLMGGLPNVGSALMNTPQARVELRNPTLRAMRANEIARGAAAGSALAGLSAVLGVIGALCGAAVGRYALELDVRHGLRRPGLREEELLSSTVVPPRGLGEELPPDVPRH